MKNLIATPVLIAVFILLFPGFAFADSPKLKVNNESIQFQYGQPFIENGSSLFPLRDLLISLDIPDDDNHIIWNDQQKMVSIIPLTPKNQMIEVSINANTISINGIHKNLEVSGRLVDGRVYLPARAIAEALNAKVDYDDQTNTVLIVTNAPEINKVETEKENSSIHIQDQRIVINALRLGMSSTEVKSILGTPTKSGIDPGMNEPFEEYPNYSIYYYEDKVTFITIKSIDDQLINSIEELKGIAKYKGFETTYYYFDPSRQLMMARKGNSNSLTLGHADGNFYYYVDNGEISSVNNEAKALHDLFKRYQKQFK
ncbi:copper amine oxidase N-terminal domain-containing protein [Paenibacillus periandrae]|uniref:copper amine oxidase N-terminal domain-containing protein n=1 Tax=Paenibacillus periandrae TaxID=1761741 RepID=UPI001F09624B|nr:copper amine oxidase N-terminal domain-containing protein [Paenibacillus periandrae]